MGPEHLDDLLADAKQALLWHVTASKPKAVALPDLAAAAVLLDDETAMEAICATARVLASDPAAKSGKLGNDGVLALARPYRMLERAGDKDIRRDLLTGNGISGPQPA